MRVFQKAQASHPAVAVFEGRVFADRPRRSLGEFSPLNEKGGNLWSCNVCIARELFQVLGGFDERFPYAAMEDEELRVRLEKRHERMVFLAEAGLLPSLAQSNWLEGLDEIPSLCSRFSEAPL